MLRAESDILKELNHPNIVSLKGVQETERYIYIIMDLIDGGKLAHLISHRQKKSKCIFNIISDHFLYPYIKSRLFLKR